MNIYQIVGLQKFFFSIAPSPKRFTSKSRIFYEVDICYHDNTILLNLYLDNLNKWRRELTYTTSIEFFVPFIKSTAPLSKDMYDECFAHFSFQTQSEAMAYINKLIPIVQENYGPTL